jgi:hypothetical protein
LSQDGAYNRYSQNKLQIGGLPLKKKILAGSIARP